MAAASKVYGLSLLSMASGEINYLSQTVRAMLCTSSYTPNQDTHRYKSSVTNEITGTGYTAGGATLTGKTAVYDATTNTLTLDADDPTWAAATFSGVRYVVFYIDTGTSATSPLLSYADLGQDWSVSANTFIAQLQAGGVYQHTAAA